MSVGDGVSNLQPFVHALLNLCGHPLDLTFPATCHLLPLPVRARVKASRKEESPHILCIGTSQIHDGLSDGAGQDAVLASRQRTAGLWSTEVETGNRHVLDYRLPTGDCQHDHGAVQRSLLVPPSSLRSAVCPVDAYQVVAVAGSTGEVLRCLIEMQFTPPSTGQGSQVRRPKVVAALMRSMAANPLCVLEDGVDTGSREHP